MAIEIARAEHGRFAKGASGNPRGAKPREQSIAAALRRKLDVNAFCDHLIGLAMGTLPDVPYNTQVLASSRILAYCDGLPLRSEAVDKRVTVTVEYVDELRESRGDVIDVAPVRHGLPPSDDEPPE
jgi:hypothetical protein